MRSLTSETLSGLWAATPTTWSSDGRLDEGAISRNCQRHAEARMDGVYTTDGDGEFYAIELDEFQQLARVFGRAMEETGLDAQMGVTWVNTQGTIDRLRASRDNGIVNVHVGIPFWMPPTRDNVFRFFDDLANAVPESRWIHYAHPQAGPPLSGADYAELASQFPEQFIGTKLVTDSIRQLTEILLHSPNLSHFVGDPTMTSGMQLGARGCYSYWANTLPGWARAWMDACLANDWEEALARHMKLMQWEIDHASKLSKAGHRHGIIGKARAALTSFLEDSGVTRAPYYPVPDDMRQELQRAFNEVWAEEIRAEGELLPINQQKV